MILRAVEFSVETYVKGRNAGEVQKGREVGATSNRFDDEVFVLSHIVARIGRCRAGDRVEAGALEYRQIKFGIANVAGDGADDSSEVLCAAGIEVAASIAIGIYIRHC